MTLQEWLLETTSWLADFIWGFPMLVLLCGAGLFFTLRTGFIQLRAIQAGAGWLARTLAGRRDAEDGSEGEISPFQALMTSWSASLGNGNIAGAAAAVSTGGPGAVLWMWVAAVLAMATRYAEAVAAVHFRTHLDNGSLAGGPMVYCREGIPNKSLGAFLGMGFALCGGVAALFGPGILLQTQQIAVTIEQQFGWEPRVVGIGLALLVGVVILGGIRRIGPVLTKLVSFVVLLYGGSALLVVASHPAELPRALGLIVTSAFTPGAAFGAAVGISIREALRQGLMRGSLAAEGGLGTAAMAHAVARTQSPHRQGTIAMLGILFDTLVVGSLTALAITVSGAYRESVFLRGAEGLGDSNLAVHAFNTGMPELIGDWGGLIVIASTLLFALGALIGWSYYGQVCFEHLLGSRIVAPYRILFVILLYAATFSSGPNALIFRNLGAICYAALAVPNLVALLLLSGVVARATRNSGTDSPPSCQG